MARCEIKPAREPKSNFETLDDIAIFAGNHELQQFNIFAKNV